MMAGASPGAPVSAKVDLLIAAGRAFHNSIGPALGHKMSDAIIRICEVYDGFLKALWLAIHNVPHCLNLTQKQWWSQGNYYPNLESPFSVLIRSNYTALQRSGKTNAAILVEKQSDSVPLWTRPRNQEPSLSISQTLFPPPFSSAI
jgi:hypothetical protein